MDVANIEFWFIQLLGILALVCTVWAFQSTTRQWLLTLQLFGGLLFSLHFSLLAAYTGAAMNLLIAIRNILFKKKGVHAWAGHVAWLYVFIVLPLLVLILSWNGWVSALPAIAVCLGAYAAWDAEPPLFRAMLLITTALWALYSIAVGSLPALATQAIVASFIIFGMIRHDGEWLRRNLTLLK
jgi:Bacterial inner membrane protein